MTPRELQTLILTGPRAAQCAPYVLTNESPRETYTEEIPLVIDGQVVYEDPDNPNSAPVKETVTRKVSPYAKDKAIAEILSEGRFKLVPHRINELGVREKLSTRGGALFLKLLRDLNEASGSPPWLNESLTNLGIVDEIDRWAYFDTLKCGWEWLKSDLGLDLGAEKTQQLLNLIESAHPDLKSEVDKLQALSIQADPITPEQVSIALRGPWGDE